MNVRNNLRMVLATVRIGTGLVPGVRATSNLTAEINGNTGDLNEDGHVYYLLRKIIFLV